MRATGGRRRAVKQYLLQELRSRAPLSEAEARITIRRLAESDYRVENWLTERRIEVLLKILEREGRLKGRLKLR
ncbi:MAG: hypothetical protein QW517_05500 [Thermofilaceae archaeon]